MATTKKMTKKDIEDYNQTLQQQILGLQQELTEKSLLLHDAETRVNAFERINEDADGVRDQLRYERNVTYELSTMMDSLARQFMWSLTRMAVIMESGVPPTDQEVPDEVPRDAYEYVADPDFGLHRIDAKDR
jgi:hypothetical protein